MCKKLLFVFLLGSIFSLFATRSEAQAPSNNNNDTFFLAKKKGWLGRLGKSISATPPGPAPVKAINPYLKYIGKVIRNINFVGIGFNRNMYDTNQVQSNFGVRVAKVFHRQTRAVVIGNDLFFKSGDRLFPYLLADNVRYMHDRPYLQDAAIMVKEVDGTEDSVDVIVLTKDVFSINGSGGASGPDNANVEISEDNFRGTGSRVAVSSIYTKSRTPQMGFDAEYLKRNIKGSFIDWTVGFRTYEQAFNTGQDGQIYVYTNFDKPLVTPYLPWTGSLSMSFNKNTNAYAVPDSIYTMNYKYSFYAMDGWFGYNFGSKRLLYKNLDTRLRKFIAIREVNRYFNQLPSSIINKYDYNYSNLTAILGSINVFKQDYYSTNFIYGFGRNEDVPEGFTTSLIGGWVNRQERPRPYAGVDFGLSHFSKRGAYTNYTFKFGGYSYHKNYEDVDMVINVERFSKLHIIDDNWKNRNFMTIGISKQIQQTLDPALTLQSQFGLPYFNNGTVAADFRGTVKGESVFFNMQKVLGFRLAPFVFGDMSLLTPSNQDFSKSDLYSAIGAGVRTRNENLIFGTIELKGYYFPRTTPGMKGWKVELGTNIRFKYNSTFIKMPDVVQDN